MGPVRVAAERPVSAVGGRMKPQAETRRALISLGLRVGQGAAFLAPALGLLVFWPFAFKPAVTLYVLIVGLGIVLLKVIELSRLSFNVEEIVRRYLHANDTH